MVYLQMSHLLLKQLNNVVEVQCLNFTVQLIFLVTKFLLQNVIHRFRPFIHVIFNKNQ